MSNRKKKELEFAARRPQDDVDAIPAIQTTESRSAPGAPRVNARLPAVSVRTGEAPRGHAAGKLSDRALQYQQDRVVLCRMFAGFVAAVALVNLVPAAFRWMEWLGQTDETPLPVWVSIIAFVAGWHLLYVAVLFQVPDWSSLRVTAFAMLVVVVFHAMAATMLTLLNGNHWLGRSLQLADSTSGRAGMWCFAMMCVAVIVSLAASRESSRWRRIEELTAELLSEETRIE